MNEERYQGALDVMGLVREIKRLLVGQRRADHLICRYLADLADGMASRMDLLLIYRDACDLVRARLRLSRRWIRERIRVGRALRTLPLLDAALMSGEVVYSRIREVTRVATPETDRVWLEAARRLPIRELERRVAEASGAARPRASADGTAPPARAHGTAAPQSPVGAGDNENRPESPAHNLPAEVWVLLRHAMRLVRAGYDRELTDAEAMTAVARAAILQLGGSPLVEESAGGETHSGSPLVEESAGGETHSGSRLVELLAGDVTDGSANEPAEGILRSGHQGASRNRVHHGSVSGATRKGRHDKPLTADEQLLLDLVRTGGYWNAPMLLEKTAMPKQRLITALFDLQIKHLIIQGPMGTLEA